MGTGVWIGRRLSRRGILGKSAGMAFVEYLVILLLVAVGIFVLLSWRPWEQWSQPVRPPRARPEPAQQPGQAQQLAQPPQQTQPTAQSQTPQGNQKVYFVPMGEFPHPSLEDLAAYFKARHGLKIETLPEVPIGRDLFDADRQQLIGEELIAAMKRQYPAQANDPEALLIGLTQGDMYIRGRPDWRFGFAVGDLPRFAVISSARMDPKNLGGVPDPGQLDRRLRKMVTKYIGYMYFRLPPSSSRNSVMYTPILGVDDLDEIGEDF